MTDVASNPIRCPETSGHFVHVLTDGCELAMPPSYALDHKNGEIFRPSSTRGCKISFESKKRAYELLRRYVENGTFVTPEKRDWKRQTYVSIEGSIGVGKTHLSKELASHLRAGRPDDPVYLVEERVNLEWLGAFIEDPPKRASIFQIKRLMETINAVKEMWAKMSVHREYDTTAHCVGDRLPLGNFAFATVHHSEGNIDDTVFGLYGVALSNGGPYNYPDVALLLCETETALDRIKSRDRRGESSYTTEYLEQLDEATLFVMLYVWYTGVVRVVPFHWDTFGETDHVSRVMTGFSWNEVPGRDATVAKVLRAEVCFSLLYMPYSRMREIFYKLADIVRNFDY